MQILVHRSLLTSQNGHHVIGGFAQLDFGITECAGFAALRLNDAEVVEVLGVN